MEIQKKTGVAKGGKLIVAIRERKILKENRPNHGKEFHGGYEQLYKERFHNYLGSCSRYMDNCRINEREYYG